VQFKFPLILLLLRAMDGVQMLSTLSGWSKEAFVCY